MWMVPLKCVCGKLTRTRIRSFPSPSFEVSCDRSESPVWHGTLRTWSSPSLTWMGITSSHAVNSKSFIDFFWVVPHPTISSKRNGIAY
ncbi:unnamed protein product [Durusdinium trenchii]|uniref:Uncharacterized protein n=1 Tax=Durusdinium trenchii TaxID=1381693 RepID=A0ABP0MB90_9DINO